MTTTTETGKFGSRQNFLTKKLLAHAIDMLQMQPLCDKYSLPKNVGSNTITMFKRLTEASANDVKELTEGTPDSNFSRTELKGIDVQLKQYGDKSKISDVSSETDLFKQLLIETERMGESCALKVDQLIMEEAVKNAGLKLYSGLANFTALKGAEAKDTTINCARILAIAQLLKKKRAPKFAGGYYVGVLTPEQVFDLQQDPDWKNLNVHNRGGKAIYKNEVGEIHGVKILETTAGWTETDTENTLTVDGSIYAGVFMGKGALGAVDLAGAPSAKKPQFIHINKADKSDPLNQFQTVGWKGYFGQAVLQPNWLVIARTKTLMPSV